MCGLYFGIRFLDTVGNSSKDTFTLWANRRINALKVLGDGEMFDLMPILALFQNFCFKAQSSHASFKMNLRVGYVAHNYVPVVKR